MPLPNLAEFSYKVLIRRCAIVMLEPREETSFDLGSLMAGGVGMRRHMRWLALAAHLEDPIPVDDEQREALGRISPHEWIDPVLVQAASRVLEELLACGLLVSSSEADGYRAKDEVVRAGHWWPLSALAHRHGRWTGLDSVARMEEVGLTDLASMRRRLGVPPSAVLERAAPDRRVALPRASHDVVDEHWSKRCTCRNFDPSKAVSRTDFSLMLQRVLMAQAVFEREDVTFLKKNVPSGGGLHPTNAYILVQHVEGIEPGLYHYHPVEHALEPLPALDAQKDGLAKRWMSGQYWFADAPVLIVLTARFARSFWKYRQHAKAYRALVLEIGHISQAIYLSAHEMGMGAFVTAAINERDLEESLLIDPMEEGPLAICGFGWRSDTMSTTEFDPAGRIWQAS